MMALFQKQAAADEELTAPAPKKKRKLTAKRVVALGVIAGVLCGAGFGVKALFFTAQEQVALTGTTTYGSLATRIEGTGTTVILITHDNSIAAQADRTIRVVDGKIVHDSLWDGVLVPGLELAPAAGGSAR